MQIKPLYFDSEGNLREANESNTLITPATASSIEYATLFKASGINECAILVEHTAIPVDISQDIQSTYRDKPYVDCVILEAGNPGDTVKVANIHGKVYSTPEKIEYTNSDILYVDNTGKLTTIKPLISNGAKWLVIVGRLVNNYQFIFDPHDPYDMSGGIFQLPPIKDKYNTFLFTDGLDVEWKEVRVSDLKQDFAITSFSPQASTVEVGQSVIGPIFTASYNEEISQITISEGYTPSQYIYNSNFNSFTIPETYIRTSPGSVSFTLNAVAKDNATKSASTSINWKNRLYYGTNASQPSIGTLQNSLLTSSASGEYNITSQPNEYIWFAIPSLYAVPEFSVGGFSGGFNKVASSISFVNQYGITTQYDVWRSDNHSLGSIKVKVS